MILNYLTIALRSFKRQKFFTLLNVMGLSLGLAASILIFQYVKYELGFDRFHSGAENIYRIQYNVSQNGLADFQRAVCAPAVAPELKNNFPEVMAYTRFFRTGGVIAYEKSGEPPVVFREEKAFFADTALFSVFDFKLLKGNERTCLKEINKMIVSAAIAEKYFDGEDPVGKRVLISDRDGVQRTVEITGVFADVPENSHIKFDFLVSYATLNAWADGLPETSWTWNSFYTYVMLKPGTDVAVLQEKWNVHVKKVREQEWKKHNSKEEFELRPLTDIHLYSNVLQEILPKEMRDGDSVQALGLIAVFILVIAWINYVNMATARSFKRANEVGVRKIVGALRTQLIGQFLAESFLLNIAVVVIALVLVRLFWHPFAALTGWNIPISFMLGRDFWLIVSALFFAGALLSGFYPAIVLSSFKPVMVLKGKVFHSATGNYLRKALVIFQFAAAVFLINGSWVVYKQLRFMKDKDLGIDLGETLVLKGPLAIDSLYGKKSESFKSALMSIPGVRGVASSSGIPGVENYWSNEVQRVAGGLRIKNAAIVLIDTGYIPQYKIPIKAGRNFSAEFNDENNVLINEALASEFGFRTPEEAIGQEIIYGEDKVGIVGVVANYHQMSLRSRVMPHIFSAGSVSRFYSVKLQTRNYSEVVGKISDSWRTFFPGDPVDYFFLDEFFNQQYERDGRFGIVFGLFTVLAIFIASIGLLGLASFMTIQRTKEIGIRKVLGASVTGVVVLLSRQFMQPVLIAIVVALPLTWMIMSEWLQSFSYHTAIDAAGVIVSAALVVAIAFISVSFQTLRASLTKPSETLKAE